MERFSPKDYRRMNESLRETRSPWPDNKWMLAGRTQSEQEKAERAQARLLSRAERNRQQAGPTALVCGLSCWVLGLLLRWSWFALGLAVMGVIVGGIGLGIPERRGQSIAGFILALVYCFLVLVGVSTIIAPQS